ncbi:TrmH family RNA methyltransferase [Thermus sediminis]|uniref:TrmH family RNA methyltransferase n=1 Tax=Thermus sediminis TaxID=1761908 RepID=UPI000E3D39EA|nr:RNA methyltransferase [Thermus sediminis]
MGIASPRNPKVKALAALKERKERERTGLFLVEGRREVERALRAGLEPLVLLLGPRAGLEERLLTEGKEVLLLSQAALERVSSRENPAQLIGVFPIPQKDLAQVRLPKDPLVLVLLGLEKPGNLGAILRSADGAGVDLVLVAEGVDLYSPQAIRNATGVVFGLPVFPTSEEEAARFLEAQGLPLVAATPRGERVYWEEDYKKGVAFLLGAEDQGLPEAWLVRAHARVRIPMRGQADSLNVSVSAALLLYEALRQRSSQDPPQPP